jgi:hypothetical protein
MRTKTLVLLVSALSFSVGCIGEIGMTGDDDDDDGDGSGDPVTCQQARTYAGFGGPLEADRAPIPAGGDRLRVKPFTALALEYARALGLASFDTRTYAATFGRPPARWYAEPAASASTVYAAFALAFDACSQHTAARAADYSTAPTPVIAERLCRDLARAAWHREATDAEAATCASYAVTQTNSADAPAKRWAYACAAVLSASGFLTY